MSNPFFSNKTSPNGATAPNDSLNESYKRYFRGYNHFNLTRQFYTTERYGDINFMEVVEGVEGDNLTFGNKHYLRSYTLKSPIMFDIYKKKTYFAVNNQAVLPINWKKVYKQPNKGDDVSYHVNCVSDLLPALKLFVNNLKNLSSEFPISFANIGLRSLLLLESILSDGSLLSSMNCHLKHCFSINAEIGASVYTDFDEAFDFLFNRWFAADVSSNFSVRFPSLSRDFTPNSFENTDAFLELLRTFSDWEVLSVPDNFISYLSSFFNGITFNYVLSDFAEDDSINLSRLVAYQLVCAQFYTRDSVDNVYDSETFMDNLKSIALSALPTVNGSNVWPTFNYNGSRVDYDVFSGHVFDSIFNTMSSNVLSGIVSSFNNCYNYFHALFFYRKSLRYGDYFVGAKTLPYAPLDVTADVVGSGVSALDMTRSIIAQRFANAVERVSNTWKDYLKGVTGGVAAPNPLEPRFLSNSTSTVDGFEVENTANAQFTNNNISTILKSGNSNYVYEVQVSEPCIIIGVSTYEVPRVYSRTTSRFFKHTDRFNMFNKFFQNIGDQEISNFERSSNMNSLSIFGYTPRHMEYKQRYPFASGGFINQLPGYAFITDNDSSNQVIFDLPNAASELHISSFYLRNKNFEFDRFYSSLSGHSLASRFHFIVKYDLICQAKRQMEYSPSIL